MTPTSGPPRLAQALLHAMLDPAVREFILGDLADQYRVTREAQGARAAGVRYWRHVLHSIRPSANAHLGAWRRRRQATRGKASRSTHTLGEAMSTLRADLRFAFRMLRRNPLFAAVTVTTLALGIGANTAIFSVVRGILLKPLPYAEPAQLAVVQVGWDESGSNRDAGFGHSVSEPELYDFRRGNRTLEGIGAYSTTSVNVTGVEGEAERVNAATASADLFGVLGVTAGLGRTFTPEEDLPGADGVAVLGQDFWQRRYAGDADILGKDIMINGRPRTVVGVMASDFKLPTDFAGGQGSQIWLPIRFDEDNLEGRGSHYLRTVARVRPGVSIQQASSDLQTIAEALTEQGHYSPERNFRAIVTPVTDQVVGNVRPALLVLFGAVGLVLLIACANVANLMLARGESRKRELAVRTALGAARSIVMRQLLTESVVLGLAGGLAGVVLAQIGLRALVALDPSSVPRLSEVQLDGAVLFYATGISVLTGLIFGLAPALRSGQVDLQSDLREGARGATSGAKRHRVQRALVGTQIGLAVMLVIAASLTIRSFAKLAAIDPGFDASNVLTFRLSVPYRENADISSYYVRLLDRITALPGVRSAGAARVLPLAQRIGDWSIGIEGRQEKPGEDFDGDWQFVTPGYFETMRIPLHEGRFFDSRDQVDGHQVVIVNQAMASLYWPGETAIGKRIRFGNTRPWVEIVGVVGDIRHNGISGQINSKWYAPHAQTAASLGFTSNAMTLVIRTDGDPLSIVSVVRGEVRTQDANVPVAAVQAMENVLGASVAEPRFTMTLLLVFGGVALVLAAVGVYGVISYTISERTHEWGLRRALGATAGDVVGMVVRQGMAVAAVGVIAGLVGAYWLTQFMSSLLYETGARDPVTFLAVPVILVLVAFAATLLPARRAVAVEPSRALREG